MTSSSEFLELERVTINIPFSNLKLYITVACVDGWSNRFYELIGDKAAAAVKPDIVCCVDHAVSAAVSAYTAWLKGKHVARKPGIEIVLALTGRRNIAKALSLAAPSEGSKAIVIAVSDREFIDAVPGLQSTRCKLDPVRACRILLNAKACENPKHATALLVSMSAAYPILARIYV